MITIIGAGKVGTSAAAFMMLKELDDILLIDIIPNKPQGEATWATRLPSLVSALTYRAPTTTRIWPGATLSSLQPGSHASRA